MKKRLLSAFLSLCMVLTMVPTVAFAVEDDNTGTATPINSTVYDLSEDTTDHTFTEDCTLTGSTDQQVLLNGGEDGIEVALQNVDIHVGNASGIKIQGNVLLHLVGENTVEGGNEYRTGYAGIEVDPTATLTISGLGSLNALAGAGKQDVTGSSNYTKYARGGDGIGGNGRETGGPAPSGNLIVKNGTVIAKGMAGGSGIGCNSISINGGTVNTCADRENLTEYENRDTGGYGLGSSDTASISILDGIITAEGDDGAPGIGANNINISGGTIKAEGNGGIRGNIIEIGGDAEVDATSTKSREAIGIISNQSENKIVIKDMAAVTAIGGPDHAGIGGAAHYIEISGSSNVIAYGGDGSNTTRCSPGAGIGGTNADGTIVIDTTGVIEAYGGNDSNNRSDAAAGIGGNANCSGSNIKILNGVITAVGGNSSSSDFGGGAGIGGGGWGSSGNIQISDGTLYVTGGNYAAGIGSGFDADVDSIEITGGEIDAFGGSYGAAIGSGQYGGIGNINIIGGTIKAYAVSSAYGVAIGSGYRGKTGEITISGGTVWAFGKSDMYSSLAIGGYSTDVPVKISSDAQVYAFSGSLASQEEAAHQAIPDVHENSTAAIIQGIFAQSYPIYLNQTLAINGNELVIPDEVVEQLQNDRYWGFAFTVPTDGEDYQFTKVQDGKTYAATYGGGDEASNQLSTSVGYDNLYWSEIDESGDPIDTVEPDKVIPDESWMEGYQGTAVYNEETGVTTITGSITDGKYLYVIPEDTTGKVVLDGTGYIDALINQHVNNAGELWNPGSSSGDLPIVIKNNSELKYSYADTSFGINEGAEAQERYHIASTFGNERLGAENDKDILRTACQPIQALYNKSSDSITTADLINVEAKIKEIYGNKYATFAEYALDYYKTNFEDAADADTLLDLPVKYQLNLMGYASIEYDYSDGLVQGNMGTSMETSAANNFLESLTEEQRNNVIQEELGGKTRLYLLETDPQLLEMGRDVAYRYGIAFTFDRGTHSITTGDSANSEENLKYLNEALGWNALMSADLSAEALQNEQLNGAQKAIADTAGKISLIPGATDDTSMPRGQLAMPGYAIPNAMFSTAMLRGLTMKIELDASVTIQPADITIYTGGDGYESVVNGSGNEIGTTNQGLPTPGFYITLPDDVNQWLLNSVPDEDKIKNAKGEDIVDLSGILTFTYDDGQQTRTWELERYDEKVNDNNSIAHNKFIYRILPATDQNGAEVPIRLQFTDGNEFMTSDDFSVNLSDLYHEYDMTIYAGDLDQGLVQAVITLPDESSESFDAMVESGKLTVRGVTDNNTTTTSVVTTPPTTEVNNITAQVSANNKFMINSSKLEVQNYSAVELLVDSLVPDQNNTLVNAAVEEFDAIPNDYDHETRYLDLVDTSNGNAYVTASEHVTVYWDYPAGTDENTEFYLVHYEGLDRNDNDALAAGNYTMTLYSEANNNLETTPQGIKFTVDSFSPFALFWEDDNGGGGGGGGGSYTPPEDLNTVDHVAYIIGYPDGSVRPQGNITRAEVATIFFRMLTDEARSENWSQTNSYTDVPSDYWYNNAVSTLSNMGIISGYPDGTFRPDAPITRAEFTKIAVGFFDEPGNYVAGTYEDVSENAWYADFIAAAVDLGLIEGYPDGTIRPEATITRAEACTIVNRTLGRVPDKDHLLPADEMRVWPDNSDTGMWYYEQMQEATNSHDYEWIGEDDDRIENWTEKLEDRDWAALELEWSQANDAPGGEVVD